MYGVGNILSVSKV
jgi:hypothetical protein